MARTVERNGEAWTCDWATQVGIPALGARARPIPAGARARVRCTCHHREVVFTTDVDWESWPEERLRAEIDRCLGEEGR
jgi:hypothetical protein